MAAAKKPMMKAPTKAPVKNVTPKPKTTNTKPGVKTPMPKKVTKAPVMPTRRPAVGTDKSAKKQFGDSSWNNGYTN